MKKLYVKLFLPVIIAVLLCTTAFTAQTPDEIIITAPEGTAAQAQGESAEGAAKSEAAKKKYTIIFDSPDDTLRYGGSFLNPDTSPSKEPAPAKNRPAGDYSDKYFYITGREYAKSKVMADDLKSYLLDKLPLTAYGGLYSETAQGKEPYGVEELCLWVCDKAAVEAVLTQYPYELGQIRFYEAEYSLKDFETLTAELAQQELAKTERLNISVGLGNNRLYVSVLTADYDGIARLCDYISASPLKGAIRFSVDSETNPDT